jgi:hypothetical protein
MAERFASVILCIQFTSLLHVLQEFFLLNIRLFQNRQECTCCDLGVAGDRDKPTALGMKEMDMTAGLADRPETKNGKDLYYLKS